MVEISLVAPTRWILYNCIYIYVIIIIIIIIIIIMIIMIYDDYDYYYDYIYIYIIYIVTHRDVWTRYIYNNLFQW